MEWFTNISNKFKDKTQQVKDEIIDVGQKVKESSSGFLNKMFPFLSDIPEERNAIQSIFGEIFKKKDRDDEQPTGTNLPEVQPAIVEPTSTPTLEPMPTPTPIISITPEGSTRSLGRYPTFAKV